MDESVAWGGACLGGCLGGSLVDDTKCGYLVVPIVLHGDYVCF